MIYAVTIERTEHITFQLEADNREDAIERCLSDGDEVMSRTTNFEVVDVEATP